MQTQANWWYFVRSWWKTGYLLPGFGLVCRLLGVHFPTYVFHSHNSPQTHQHNVPSLQQLLVFTHNIYIYLFSNDITGTIINLAAFHSFA